jgi:hypothetical protein
MANCRNIILILLSISHRFASIPSAETMKSLPIEFFEQFLDFKSLCVSLANEINWLPEGPKLRRQAGIPNPEAIRLI